MLGFMEKPSKKLYSEYYEVIQEPIDFLEIESKIRADQYSSENDLVKDFKLMFSNCRQFNEENSPIYEDSLVLEKYLIDKVGQNVTPEKKEKTVVRVYVFDFGTTCVFIAVIVGSNQEKFFHLWKKI